MAGNNTLFAQLDVELTNKDGQRAVNSGITMIQIKGAKVVRAEDFLRIIDGNDYKKGWGDI
jgi:hypothetical protein